MPGVAQAVLKRVAALLVAGSLGGTARLTVPEEVMESLLDPDVRRELAASLGALLPALGPLERSELLLPMAASDDANVRFVAASALAWPFEAIGARSAVAFLALDASADVRDAARRAARARGISLGRPTAV
jgi:hypothetical protein